MNARFYLVSILFIELYSEPSQISKMEIFAKIVNSFQPLTISAKIFILDISQVSTHSSVTAMNYHANRKTCNNYMRDSACR